MEFGNLKRVPINSIWKNEEIDFTPFLADHIKDLGNILGLDLETITTEADVGDFSLDLLAKDLSTNRNVVIENQYNNSNHDHFGKLITYAANYNAGIIIWISEKIREEHRAAIDWLNYNTNEDLHFFAIEIEVFQIDDSKPVYNFKLIASPNEWQKSLSKSVNKVSSKSLLYREFFQKLLDELRSKHRFTNAKAGQPQSWYSFSTGVKGFTFGVSFALGGRARTELYIDTNDKETNKRIFRQFECDKEQIELEFNGKLEWELLEDARASRIAIYCSGNIDDPQEDLEIVHQWMVDKLLKFKFVFKKRLQSVIK